MFDVFLVGDNPEIARLMSRIIKRNGFNVTVITNSSNIPPIEPHLIIFDCDMPPMLGLKKYKKLVQRYNKSKILWISSNCEDEIEALELGADDWIKKPFNVDVFITRIKKLCKQL